MSATVLLSGASLHAQDTTSIRGIVRDMVGRPLGGIEVILVGLDRNTYTNAEGEFALGALPFRVYNLLVRHPGYAASRARIPAESIRPTEIEIYLTELPQVLDNIVVVGRRRGLYGLVGDSARNPVAGARVVLMGGAGSTTTDSAGQFHFPDIKRGPYIVAAEVPGMVSRPLHVDLPANRSLEVVLFVAPAPVGYRPDHAERIALQELGRRLAFNSASTRMSREELARHEGRTLCEIARLQYEIRSSEPDVIVDGVTLLQNWPLCDWNADEVELVEWGVRGCEGLNGTVPGTVGLSCTGSARQLSGRPGRRGYVLIWTRKEDRS